MFSGMTSLRELTFGSGFVNVNDNQLGLPDVLTDATYTGRWQNVGGGTSVRPAGEMVVTSVELMALMGTGGAVLADTWVWQRVPWSCPGTARFRDVAVRSQFHCYVEWLAATEITTGWDDGTFRPGAHVERQAMAAFLYRGLADSAGFTTPGQAQFRDKLTNGAFFRQVEWLAHEGISTGWGAGAHREFRPSATVERQAMAAFLYRAAGSPPFTPPTQATFRDVPVGAAFFREIEWLFSTEITTGWDLGTHREFRPGENVERQAMAAFLYRAFNNGHLSGTHLNWP